MDASPLLVSQPRGASGPASAASTAGRKRSRPPGSTKSGGGTKSAASILADLPGRVARVSDYLDSIVPGLAAARLLPSSTSLTAVESVALQPFLERLWVWTPVNARTGLVAAGGDVCLDNTMSQAEVVGFVIQTLLRRSCETAVLVQGYRRANPQRDAAEGATAVHGVECYYPNTLVNWVKRPEWELLLAKIGDELMIHLLLDRVLLYESHGFCFVQLSGPHMFELSKLRSDDDDGNVVGDEKAGAAATSKRRRSKRRRRQRAGTAPAASLPSIPEADALPRYRLFYVPDFPSRPGLRVSHPLNRLPATEDGG